jgi:hypothetical protein
MAFWIIFALAVAAIWGGIVLVSALQMLAKERRQKRNRSIPLRSSRAG